MILECLHNITLHIHVARTCNSMIHVHVYNVYTPYGVIIITCRYNYNIRGLTISAKLIFLIIAVNFLNNNGFSSLTYRENKDHTHNTNYHNNYNSHKPLHVHVYTVTIVAISLLQMVQ